MANRQDAAGRGAPNQGVREADQARFQVYAHKQRCSHLPPVTKDEAAALVARFLDNRGVTQCPTAYLVPVR